VPESCIKFLLFIVIFLVDKYSGKKDYLRALPFAILLRGAYPKAPAPSALRFLHFSALVNKFTPLQNAKTPTFVGAFVPRKGFLPP